MRDLLTSIIQKLCGQPLKCVCVCVRVSFRRKMPAWPGSEQVQPSLHIIISLWHEAPPSAAAETPCRWRRPAPLTPLQLERRRENRSVDVAAPPQDPNWQRKKSLIKTRLSFTTRTYCKYQRLLCSMALLSTVNSYSSFQMLRTETKKKKNRKWKTKTKTLLIFILSLISWSWNIFVFRDAAAPSDTYSSRRTNIHSWNVFSFFFLLGWRYFFFFSRLRCCAFFFHGAVWSYYSYVNVSQSNGSDFISRFLVSYTE